MSNNKKKFVSVDIESNGPCPGIYSMISIGAVIVEPDLNKTFYGTTKPISHMFQPDAYAVTKMTFEKHEKLNDPKTTMNEFAEWLFKECGSRDSQSANAIFVSDNAGFDWQFINYYFWNYLGFNPFGFSSVSLTSLYKGLERDMFSSFKHLRKTKHTHNPVDDAKGNAEAMLEIFKSRNFKGTGI